MAKSLPFITLPPNLSIPDICDRLGVSPGQARTLCRWIDYEPRDGRAEGAKARWEKERVLNPAKVDWRESNAAIARRFGVSRERVRQVRSTYFYTLRKKNCRTPRHRV